MRDLGPGSAGVPVPASRGPDQMRNCSLSKLIDVTYVVMWDAGRRGRLRSQDRSL
jgi:hypothetical protein